MITPLVASNLPLPLVRAGKVREVYEVDSDRLLLVASDRVSAFDVVCSEPIPDKGRVLTRISAHWFDKLSHLVRSHFISADIDQIVAAVPALADHRDQIAGRSMLVRRTEPVPFECVVRGYLAGSAWSEYRESGTLAGEPLPQGLLESSPLEPPIFSPATKAVTGHDENVTRQQMSDALGEELTDRLMSLSMAIYAEGQRLAAERGLIIADTKFEFGLLPGGEPILIDEVLTPDSSRFWPLDGFTPGRSQPSFDKQPLRDWLQAERQDGRWNGETPAPQLPVDVIAATSDRYRDACLRITGTPLPESS